MKSWNMRSHEVAFLLNPAFCGRVLYSTIKTYNEKNETFIETTSRVVGYKYNDGVLKVFFTDVSKQVLNNINNN